MERVAERAAVSKGLGYAYFRDVAELAALLWDREVAEVYRRVEAAVDAADSLEEGLRRAVGAYFDVISERGALLGALQAHFGGSSMERGSRRRVRAFLGFWARQLQRAAPLGPGVALALAGMMVSAADAGARSWGGGLLGRAEAERLCVRFLVEGFRGARPRTAQGPPGRASRGR
jgi:AcrR family transcriptional regulator